MVKFVLEEIPVYWISLARIPKGILKAIRKFCFNFLWSSKHNRKIPIIKWQDLAFPKKKGEWGLKNIQIFSQALASKIWWCMLFDGGSWGLVMKNKYIKNSSISDWMQRSKKSTMGVPFSGKFLLMLSL